MVENDYEKTVKIDDSIRVTSVESKIGIIRLQSFHPRKQSKTHDCLSPPTTKPTPSPIDRPISSNVALCRDLENDGGITPTVYPPHAIILPPSLVERPQNQEASALNEEEWEIVRIVGKRRKGKVYEYKVCWKETWLFERELGNA